MVVVFKNFDDLGETAVIETECFEKHFVDGGAADEGEVADIVVVCFEKQRFLFCPLGELDQAQQMVFRELSSPLVVYVDSADAVPVEAGCTVFPLHLMLFFNIRSVSLVREAKDGKGCHHFR